ncbi:YgiW/YdeI family stress tolerance OB fold protein [Pelodictyon luteolum]|nr:NirD/YgiW/YdeI family stress tolerance protein [Pelodictyon luteolum]
MMKKMTLMALLGTTSMLLSTPGFAAYRGPDAAVVQPKGPRAAAAASVRDMPENSRVMLEGRIVNKRRGDCYTFRDRSGETLLEIRNRTWNGFNADHTTLVRVFGKTERRGRQTCVEVKQIERADRGRMAVGPQMRPGTMGPGR